MTSISKSLRGMVCTTKLSARFAYEPLNKFMQLSFSHAESLTSNDRMYSSLLGAGA